MKINKPTSNKFIRFFKILGPGLVTGAGDDDPSGIATYSQAGAAYGLSTLWTALITFQWKNVEPPWIRGTGSYAGGCSGIGLYAVL